MNRISNVLVPDRQINAERRNDERFWINEMLEMQRSLQKRYEDKWGGLSPEICTNQLL